MTGNTDGDIIPLQIPNIESMQPAKQSWQKLSGRKETNRVLVRRTGWGYALNKIWDVAL